MELLRCDLHTHSNCSDGSCDPEEVIAEAKAAELSAVALCDHNTVSGLPRFKAAAELAGIIPVPGVEVSCEYSGKEIHILGLFIRDSMINEIATYLVEINIRKIESNEILTCNLNSAGYKIDYEKVAAISPDAIPNRVHFAQALMDGGYVSSIKEAFATVLSEERGLYAPAKKPDAFETISFLRSCSALPVLAHPFLDLTYDELVVFLPKAREFGLAGMECLYSTFNPEQTRSAYKLAAEFGLLPSGGSDYHGANKPDISIGKGRGELVIPIEIYEKLAEKTKQ